ncbi:unnamed protein product [Calypogeia fissa]
MATGSNLFAVAARSCALVLLLIFLSASCSATRSCSTTGVPSSHENATAHATEGSHGSTAAVGQASKAAENEILIAHGGEAKPLDVPAECFAVCCWQGDSACPYPYCNYNQDPCHGGGPPGWEGLNEGLIN